MTALPTKIGLVAGGVKVGVGLPRKLATSIQAPRSTHREVPEGVHSHKPS